MKWRKKIWYTKEEMKRLQAIHIKHIHTSIMSEHARVLLADVDTLIAYKLWGLMHRDNIEPLSRLWWAYDFTTKHKVELDRFEELFEYAEEQLRCESISDKTILILKRIIYRIIH